METFSNKAESVLFKIRQNKGNDWWRFLNLCVYVYPAEAGELQLWVVTIAPLVELPAG